MSTPFLPLETEGDLQQARARSEKEPVVLFKHSLTCPISARAHQEMEALARDGAPVYRLLVQHARSLARLIANDYTIRHESPQAIVLCSGEPVFHASHHRVRADALTDAIEEATETAS